MEIIGRIWATEKKRKEKKSILISISKREAVTTQCNYQVPLLYRVKLKMTSCSTKKGGGALKILASTTEDSLLLKIHYFHRYLEKCTICRVV